MTNSVSKKERVLQCTKAFTALLWMFFFFNTGAEGQTTTIYTQQIGNYYDIWTTGTAGTFNQGIYQVGMFANGAGTKQVVRWRKFRTDVSGANTSDRALQVGDQFVVTLSATRANGRIGFALLASPSTGSWANRESNYAISINLDGPAYSGGWGVWYLRANGGSTAASTIFGEQTNYKNFTFTLTLTAPNRMNVVMTDGAATSTFNDVLLNTSNPITDYSIYLDDDYDGGANRNIFWGLSLVNNQHTVTNTGALNIGGSNSSYTIGGVIPNGLVSNTTSTSFTNNLTKTGTGSITLGASNTYTGTTTINTGTLTFNAANCLPSSNSITINGGTLEISNASALSSSNNITLTSGSLALGAVASASSTNIGSLNITGGTSINLSNAPAACSFTLANTSGLASGNLTITGWSPTKRIFITNTTHINTVLGSIIFSGFGIGAKIINTNELVPSFLYYTNGTGGGDFNQTSSWLSAGGQPPLPGDGTRSIYVQPGDNLNLNTNFSGLFVSVGSTGILTMNGTNALTTSASSDAGISNAGTITMVTTSVINIGAGGILTNGGTLNMVSGSIINIGAGSTINNTGTLNMVAGSIINMGAGSILAGNGTIGASGIINFTNGGSITSTSTLPNVTIVGNVNFNTSTIGTSLEIRGGGAVTPNAPFYAVGSTLIYNVSGTYNRTTEWGSNSGQGYPHHVRVTNGTTVNLNVNPISATAFGIGGDLTIENGATLNTGALNTTNFTINGNTDVSGTFDATGMTGGTNDLDFNGNLSISGTLSLSNVSGNDLYLAGNWNRTGTFNANNRAVYLDGGNSSITATGGQTFSFLRIQKADASNTITLLSPVTISNEVSFSTGVMVTSFPDNYLTITAVASHTGGSSSSFVSGPMKKIGNAAYNFPVGKRVNSTNHYRYIGIGAGGSATDEFIAEFHRQSSTVRGWISPVAAAAGLQRISYCEHWFLGRMVGSTQRSVTLTWTNQSPCNTTYVTNVSTLRVVPYGNSGWGDDFGGTSGSPANPGTGTSTITYNTPGNYLFFTLGSTNPNDNPLPFTLLSFNGRNRTKDIELSFSVKGNDEQQHYLVERSTDGRNFTSLIKIAAIQNTSAADYTTLDEQPVNGWNYYRVTAVDNTNRSRQSQIIRVWFGNRAGNPSIYPNPVQGGNVQLFTGGMPKGMYNVQVMGVDGKIILSRTWQFDGVQPLYNLSVPQLPSGMYYLLLRGENQPPVQLKFVK